MAIEGKFIATEEKQDQILAKQDQTLTKVGQSGGRTSAIFTTNGTFKIPDGVDHIYISACGGGGGGAGNGASSGSFGGGGGASAIFNKLFKVSPGASYAITIGLGGSPGIPGTSGGSTIVAGLATLTGGAGGGTNAGGNAGGSGGGRGGNGRQIPGDAGIVGGGGSGGENGGGGGGSLGSGGGGGAETSLTSSPGSLPFVKPYSSGATGNTRYGGSGGFGAGGGGGAYTNGIGGQGGPGVVIIEW